jgi:hypothetical protein
MVTDSADDPTDDPTRVVQCMAVVNFHLRVPCMHPFGLL